FLVFLFFFFFLLRRLPLSTLFPYSTLFRSRSDPARRADRAMRQTVCRIAHRSEEHMSELQSRENLVCRLLLEKKKKKKKLSIKKKKKKKKKKQTKKNKKT